MACPRERPGAAPERRPPLAERFPSLVFIWLALGLGITAGFGLGTALFLTIAFGWPLGLWWVAAVQAHGHVQLFGWAGLFALGVGLYFLPRLRGCPAPSPPAVRTAAWLLGGGLALRGLTQPLAAGVDPDPARTVLEIGLVLSGVLELGGAAVGVVALLAAARRGPPLATRAGLVAVLPFALLFFASLLVGLALNALGLLAAATAGGPLLSGALNWTIVHLGLVGMLVSISAAISARTFPLYLRLRVPSKVELYAVFILLLAGFLARSFEPWGPDGPAGLLATVGAALEGLAMLGIALVVDVPLRRTRRVPPGREPPPSSELRAAEWLIVSAYAWLAVAGLLLVAGALAGLGLVPAPPADAERHALGAGLVTLLIFGMAVRLLPGFAGRPLYSARLVWATLWLGNAAALLRVAPLFVPPSRLTAGLLGGAGLLALAALACFTWNLWQTLREPPDRASGRPGAP